jgi:hypothetical protein
MREMPTSQFQVALVPDEWFEELSKHKWHADWSKDAQTFYAARHEVVSGKRRKIYMHRVILNAPKGIKVDHKDGNGLNNCPPNIRLAPGGANQQNMRKPRTNTSGFKGVTWHKDCQKWLAQINFDRQHFNLGVFETKEEAARARDRAALKYHGEFATLNFPSVP